LDVTVTAQFKPPRLAIVVPVYGHPGLVSEALHSALAQEADFGLHVVVVNDGCPHPETHQVLQAFALAHPDCLTYLRKPNGGLSSARNAGITHVLKNLPSVEALFMLDADNRLRPRAMAHAMAQIDAHPEAGWVYPSIDMFGIMARCDYGGPYNRLIHTQTNICEAGSLIRRTVFEAGVLFDESFRLGFEDWDFFLSAGDAGFSGVNLEDFGFFYRKRPESMLANADRHRDLLVGQIQHAHPDLYRPASQLQLEHDSAPRYALWLSDTALVRLVTDFSLPGITLSLPEYIRLYWANRTAPMQHRIPPYLVVTTETTLRALADKGLGHWLLWQLETAAPEPETMAFAALSGQTGLGEMRIATLPERGAEAEELTRPLRTRAPIWLIGMDALSALLDRPAEAAAVASATGVLLRLNLAAMPCAGLERVLETLRKSPWRAAGVMRWRWRQPSIGLRNREHYILRKAVGGQPALPRCASRTPQIGLILPSTNPLPAGFAPLLAALQPARQAGARLHVVVLDDRADQSALTLPDCPFDTLALLGAPDFQGFDARNLHFEALPLPGADPVLDDRALGLMVALSEVHVLAEAHRGTSAARLMGTLRRWGVRTFLHLPDAPVTAPGIALTLAYEHAFDRILVPTCALLTDLRARGLPAAKIALDSTQNW